MSNGVSDQGAVQKPTIIKVGKAVCVAKQHRPTGGNVTGRRRLDERKLHIRRNYTLAILTNARANKQLHHTQTQDAARQGPRHGDYPADKKTNQTRKDYP